MAEYEKDQVTAHDKCDIKAKRNWLQVLNHISQIFTFDFIYPLPSHITKLFRQNIPNPIWYEGYIT